MIRVPRWMLFAALLSGAVLFVAPVTGEAQVPQSAMLRPWLGETLPPDEAEAAGAPLRSLAVPGWGQISSGQRRGWAYLALEAAGWAMFANRRSAGAGLREDYRELAWSAGRIQNGPRQDGDFNYYERLTKWTRSGAFDGDAASSGIQPEHDVSTFNGSIWALARDIYISPGSTPDPDDASYQSALAYYVGRAYGPQFLWDWSAAPQAQQDFADLIVESDDRYREATTALGAIIANHLISAIDAYVSGGTRETMSPLAVWAEPLGAGTRWSAFLRIGSN